MTTEELRESLLAAPKNGYARITKEDQEEMENYCKRYMAFISTLSAAATLVSSIGL